MARMIDPSKLEASTDSNSVDVALDDPGATNALSAEIQRAQAGDRLACERLLKERLPRIRNLVRYLLRGDDLVDDITQQILVAIIRGLHTFQGSGRWQSWVDRITARETFAYLRRVRGERDARRDAANDLRLLQGAQLATRDAYAERRTAIQLLEALPDEQRLVIALHHIAGMSLPEVSETLGVPFETARSRARLGMRKLRAELAQERGPDDPNKGTQTTVRASKGGSK